MKKTENYDLSLLERQDSGNFLTGGVNGNFEIIDGVLKSMDNNAKSLKDLIDGLTAKGETDATNITLNQTQITELRNLLDATNGNVATLTGAVEDLQTKQPTTGETEYFVISTDNGVAYLAINKIGKLVTCSWLVYAKISLEADIAFNIEIPKKYTSINIDNFTSDDSKTTSLKKYYNVAGSNLGIYYKYGIAKERYFELSCLPSGVSGVSEDKCMLNLNLALNNKNSARTDNVAFNGATISGSQYLSYVVTFSYLSI